MSYVIWDRGECLIFNSKSVKEAWNYIYRVKEEDPNVEFNGWSQSQSGNNFVAILRDYDTVFQYDKQAKYLLPISADTKEDV